MFYSAVTKRCGLRPMDEEYITMGMAAYGTASKAYDILKRATVKFADIPHFKENLHLGIEHVEFPDNVTIEDIAAAGQQLCEEMIMHVIGRAKKLGKSKNLVYMGGVALNCLATVGFESALQYLKTDNTHLLEKFWSKTKQLDSIRNENILDVIPELGALQ